MCLRAPVISRDFPIRSNRIKKNSIVRQVIDEVRHTKVNPKPTVTAAKVMAKDIYHRINGHFKENYCIDLQEALAKNPTLQLQMKKSKAAMKQSRRERAREQKQLIERHWEAMDVTALLGTRQSFSQRDKQRMALNFETKEEAVIRSRKRKAQEEAGDRIPKRHSPDPSSTNLDGVALLDEVHKMKRGDKVNRYPYRYSI